jgi:uracil-DNA glycosylase
MNELICAECGHYRHCVRGKVKPQGAESPEVIMVFPYPEKADDEGKFFGGVKAATIKPLLSRFEGRYKLTYLMKCPTFENNVSRSGFKEPPRDAIAHCLKHLRDELAEHPTATVMTFGGFVYKNLSGDHDVKITREYGTARDVKFKDLTVKVIPNLDPSLADRHPQHLRDIDTYITKAFTSIDAPSENTEDKYEILDPKSATKFLTTLLSQYKHNKIDHIIFDIENSISLEPIQGGEIVMVSITHKRMDKARAIPFYVTNEIHHWKDLNPEEFEDYKLKFPLNAAKAKKSNSKLPFQKDCKPGGVYCDLMSVPNLLSDLVEIPWDVTDQDRAKLKILISEVLNTIPISGHNLKYDLLWCAYKSYCDLSKVKIQMDTQNVSVQLQGTGGGIDNSLKGLSRKHFNVNDDWDIEIDHYLKLFRLTKDRHYGQIPTGLLGKYACLDVWYNQKLEEKFEDENVCPKDTLEAARQVTKAVVPIIEPELKGIYFLPSTYNFLETNYTNYLKEKRGQIEDLNTVKKFMAKELAPLEEINNKKKTPLSREKLKEKAFNFNNAEKLSEVAYGKKYYGLPSNPDFHTDKGADSLSKDARSYLLNEVLVGHMMDKYKADDGFKEKVPLWEEAKVYVQKIHDYKRVSKLLKDYIQSFPDSMKDDMYYTKFNINGTITGRMSSPFHSMPNGCDIKRLVASRWHKNGGLILAADFSQLELRIVAALSNEKSMIENFKNGIDAHTSTASILYGVPPEKITKQQRSVGKTVNFAILYGKTEYNLASDLGIPVEEAKRLMNTFYAKVPRLIKWKKEQEDITLKTGFVETVLGRRINLPNAFSKRESDIAETKRLAVNYRVQSPASELVRNQIVEIWNDMKGRSLNSILLATVHDSMEYDVYPGELFQAIQLLKKYGEDVIPEKYPWVTCPLHLDVEFGTSWGGAMSCHIEELSSDKLVFTTTATKKDFVKTVAQASPAYKVSYDILGEKPIDPTSYKEDVFFKDNVEWQVRCSFTQ